MDFSGLEQQYGLPQGLLASIQQQESGGNPNAINYSTSTGQPSIGNFQFQPATAGQYGIDPRDPNQAAQGAAMMLGDLSKKYNGDIPSMLAGYNWGQGNVDRHGLQAVPPETQKYIQQVTSRLPQATASDPQRGVFSSLMNAAVPDAQASEPQSIQPSAVKMMEVELPNGKIITDVPSDMSKADLMAKLNANGIETGEKQGILSDMGKSGAAGLAKDASYLVNPMGIVRGAGNAIFGGATRLAGAAYEGMGGELSPGMAQYLTYPLGDGSDTMSQIQNTIVPALVKSTTGMNMNYQPETAMGRATQATAMAVPAIAGNEGSILQMMTRAAGMGGGSELGRGAAESMGFGDKGQQVGGILGGTAGGFIPEIAGHMQDNSLNLSSADLRKAASERYGAGEEQGAQFQPKITNDFIDASSSGVFSKSARVADLAADTPSAKLINDLQSWRNTPMSLSEVLDLDKHIGNLADTQADTVTGRMSPEGANLLKIQRTLRDTTMNAPAEDMVMQPIAKQPDLSAASKELDSLNTLQQNLIDSIQTKSKLAGAQGGFWRQRTLTEAADDAKGLANVRQQIAKQQSLVDTMQESIKNAPSIMDQATQSKNAVDAITQGRQLSAAAFKMNDIERIEQKASNANNPIEARKQGYRALANNESRLNGYSVPERAAINKAANTGIATHFLNVVGSNLNPILAAEFGGPLGAAGAYVVSRAARGLGGKLQANRGNAVSKLISNRPSVIEAMKANKEKP